MVQPRETLYRGAQPRCEDCGITPELKVYRSNAGWYIGTWCGCGPYSRESGYYSTLEAAERELQEGTWIPR